MSKIKTLQEVVEIAKRLREEGKKIVTINGSFDMLHAGHVRSLKEAKAQGDVLIVGLNSDKSVKAYKSIYRPIIPQDQRAFMLEAIEYVDYIVVMDEPEIAAPLIRAVKPSVHANSAEYGANCVEAPAIKEVGARLFMIPKYDDISTTNIIKRVLDIYRHEGRENCK